MAKYDVFNGDADGIFSLIQLRLAAPSENQLITGVKRDIKLLEKLDVNAGDELTVLDISMESNASGLASALEAGAKVLYFDHHRSGDVPQADNLEAHIHIKPDVCTGLIVNNYLNGKHPEWAVAAAFGDNLHRSASALAERVGLSGDAEMLCQLGELVNYNAYGKTLDDLLITPAELYRELYDYQTPNAYVSSENSSFNKLKSGFAEDMSQCDQAEIILDGEKCRALVLPDAAWSRRASGTFGNSLARLAPERAHAILTKQVDGSFVVSVRAPLNDKQGADTLCTQFPTGGGRPAAAGINHLESANVAGFLASFEKQFA